ncbi:MAG: SCO1664 family protein [Actinomycetota bacterium]
MSDRRPTAQPEALSGDIEVLGLLPGSSNYTFLAQLPDGVLVVYKPRKGETPLWDFPGGTLCRREAAAFLLSRDAGWDHVPPTILRDGPLGEGAVQLFVDHDPSVTAFDLLSTHLQDLRSIALFDVVANNADRKAGHVLVDRQGLLWGIDHGLCFHAEPKLRTVLWHFVGEPLSEQEVRHVVRLRDALESEAAGGLSELLSPEEVQALAVRAEQLLDAAVFPEPGPGRPIPWPPI